MRVFLAGATGVIGRPLLTQLAEAGHDVVAISRSEDGAKRISGGRVRGVACDVYDAAALTKIVVDAKPDVILHQMTALPKRMHPRKVNAQTAATNRLRTEGTKNLLDAARAAGTKRFVTQSIAFITKPEGPPVLDEMAPLYLDAPEKMRAAIDAAAEMERILSEANDIESVVLRYGFFYGPGTVYAHDGAVTEDVKRGMVPIVGAGQGKWSFIHVDDAAAATLLALDRGRGVYNVTDDDPASAEAWITEMAARFGKKPMRVPVWLARLVAGPYGIYVMTELRGASNAKAKRELDWAPKRPSWRGGLGI